jgi:hypothetical protein
MKRLSLIAGTAVLFACGITEPGCACSPPESRVLITGTVSSPAMAPVPGAAVQVRLMNGQTCEDIAVTIVHEVQTDAAGRFRHTGRAGDGRMCYRVWAEPPQGSALAAVRQPVRPRDCYGIHRDSRQRGPGVPAALTAGNCKRAGVCRPSRSSADPPALTLVSAMAYELRGTA